MNTNPRKRVLSLLLTLALLLTHVPATVFAAEDTEIAAETVASTEPPETETPTEMPQPESTAAPTAAPTEPETQPPVVETEAPTEAPQPEETAAPTEPATEPPVPETETPTEPPVEETTAPTEPPIPEETTAPTEGMALEEGLVTDEAALAYSGTCGSNLQWSLDTLSGKLTITGTGEMKNYYNTDYTLYPPWKSYVDSIKSVVIENGVTSIGSYAFYSCRNLTSITIPDSVKSINERAFAGCSSLTDITIPDGVRSIDECAFISCSSLTSITIPESVKTIGESAFSGCDSLTSVTIPDSVITIGNYAFSSCENLMCVTIGNGVTGIGDYAFRDCYKLKAIMIGRNVTDIGNYAFSTCSGLRHVFYGGTEAQWKTINNGSANDKLTNAKRHCEADGLKLTKYETTTCTAKTLFKCDICGDCLYDNSFSGSHQYVNGTCTACGAAENLTYTIYNGEVTITEYTGSAQSFKIPATMEGCPVTCIGQSAFNDCTGLTDITIPDSVTEIGPAAFEGCTGLKRITIGSGVTRINSGAFENCNALTDVHLTDLAAWVEIYFGDNYSNPLRTNSLEKKLYLKDQLLTDLVIPAGVTRITDGAFYRCTSLTSVTLPDSATSIGSHVFYNCWNLENITISKTATSIGEYAFYNCINLKSITIPDSVASIGRCAFSECIVLKRVTIGSGVTFIDYGAFEKCSSLTEVYISDLAAWLEIDYYSSGANPLGVNKLEKKLYVKGNPVTDLVIPAGVTEINARAFSGYNGLMSVTIPDSVTSIGYYAFSGCTGLKRVTFGNAVTSIGSAAFNGCTSLTSITIPESVTSISDSVFYNCSSLSSVNIPTRVTTIAEKTFFGCSSLKSIEIPYGVTSIGAYAFEGSGLVDVRLPDSVTGIGTAAFRGCSSLKAINIPKGKTSLADYVFDDCSLMCISIPESLTSITWRPFWFSDSTVEHVFYGGEEEHWQARFSGFFTNATVHYNTDGLKLTDWENTTCTTQALYKCDICGEVLYNKDYPVTHTYVNGICKVCGKMEGMQYSVTDGKATITGYTGTATELVIPTEIEGYPVTGIRNSAFSECSTLTSVTILEGVTTIGNDAFYNCRGLEDITIPDSVTHIGESAFQNCDALASVTMGNGLTDLGVNAFKDCTSLTDITIPNGVTIIGGYTFYNCTSLTSITIPDSVQSIDDNAFYGCTGLRNVVLGSGVTSIGGSAFEKCSALPSISIPAGVTSIEYSAFHSCTNLKTITFAGDAPYISYNAFKNVTANAYYPARNATWTSAVKQNYGGKLTWAEPPKVIAEGTCGENVTWMLDADGRLTVSGAGRMKDYSWNDYAPWYDHRGSIRSVVIEDGVTSIGASAFLECSSLTSVTIVGDVTVIGWSAFEACSNLEDIYLPDSVTYVSNGAFSGCSMLSGIRVSDSHPVYCNDQYGVLYNKEMTTLVSAPGALSGAYVIPDSVTCINMYAFESCSRLTSVRIPDGIEKIAERTFLNCSSLKTVNIPDTVTSISYWAFDSCSSLTSIEIPDSVTEICCGAFYHCSSLTSIKIPDGIPGIEWSTFCGCSSLTSVDIPDSVTYIDLYAFVDCSALESIDIPNGVTSIGESAFAGCSTLTDIELPDQLTSIGVSAFAGCRALASIDIPNGVTGIGKQAFLHCCNLEHIVLPVSVNGIGEAAFYGCSSLSDVYYGGTAEQWEAFGDSKPNAEYVHYSCTEPVGHWQTATTDVTCVSAGGLYDACPCGYERNNVTITPALGHLEIIDAAVPATCTESGLTEGSHCETCGEVFTAQEMVPALGHAYAECNDTLVCGVCGAQAYIRICQDYLAMDLQSFTEVRLVVERSGDEPVAWSVEDDADIISLEDGVVSVTGNGIGNAEIVATITVDNGLEETDDNYKQYTVSSRCRVEVAESIQLKGIQLSTDKVTTELFKTDYATFEVLLRLPQNEPETGLMTVSRPAAMALAGEGSKKSVAIDSVAFTSTELNDLFELRMLDDRTVQLVPRYETAIENALANPKSVKAKYTDTVTVTVQGKEFTSEMLTLTVKQTKPKLKGTVAAFNSFYSGQSQPIVITGGTVTDIYEDESKPVAIPDWLSLGDGVLTLAENAPLSSKSGKAYVMVETEQWRIPAAVTLSVKNTYAARLKLSATSVNMSMATEGSTGAAMKLLCTSKGDTLIGMNVEKITATNGFSVENFSKEDGSFTLVAPDGFAAGTITLKVHFEGSEITRDLKLKVTPKVVTVKPASTSVTLNRTVKDSARITITATPADYRITRLEDLSLRLTGTETIDGKKVTVNRLDPAKLEVGYENGQLIIKTTKDTPEKATYKLYISSGGSKEAAVTINVMSGEPSVTYKATGSMDLSFPAQAATIKPTFKNYKGEIVDFSYGVTELKGKAVVNEDVKDAFYVEYDGTAFKIRFTDDQINTGNTYQVRLDVKLNNGETIGNTINLKVKRTAVKLKLSASKLTLNKLTGDSGSIDVTCTTKGYAFTEPVCQVNDKYGNNAAGKLDIIYKGGKLTVSTKASTAYGMTYTVTLRGDAYGTPAKLTVSIPMEEKSTVTATLKAKGSIDVIRDGSAITLTPTYKNITDRTDLTESLVFSKTANRVTTDATDLFDYSKNGDGTFTVTKKAGAKLDHSAKYKVKLVTYKGEAKLCETKEISISVKAGSAKLTAKTDNTTLFAKDKNDRALVWFEATDATLNGVKEITIANTTQAKQFEIIPYGDGLFAIGFKDGKADSALTKRNINSVSIKLNVFVKGNETAKASTTATVKLTIVK